MKLFSKFSTLIFVFSFTILTPLQPANHEARKKIVALYDTFEIDVHTTGILREQFAKQRLRCESDFSAMMISDLFTTALPPCLNKESIIQRGIKLLNTFLSAMTAQSIHRISMDVVEEVIAHILYVLAGKEEPRNFNEMHFVAVASPAKSSRDDMAHRLTKAERKRGKSAWASRSGYGSHH